MVVLVEGIQNQSCFKRLRRLQTSQLGALALLTMEEVLMVRSSLYLLDLRQLEIVFVIVNNALSQDFFANNFVQDFTLLVNGVGKHQW